MFTNKWLIYNFKLICGDGDENFSPKREMGMETGIFPRAGKRGRGRDKFSPRLHPHPYWGRGFFPNAGQCHPYFQRKPKRQGRWHLEVSFIQYWDDASWLKDHRAYFNPQFRPSQKPKRLQFINQTIYTQSSTLFLSCPMRENIWEWKPLGYW